MIHSILYSKICKFSLKTRRIFFSLYSIRFEWSAALNDIRRQHLLLSVKNNSPLFAQEQTYMGEVSLLQSQYSHISFR